MLELSAKGVSNGIAIAKIHVLERGDEAAEKMGSSIDEENERLNFAFKRAKEELDLIQAKLSGDEAEIFTAHKLMLEDPEVEETAKGYINQGYDACYSVYRAKNDLKEIFYSMEDEYFRARANDVEDVLSRVIKILKGGSAATLEGKFILVSDELYPSETLEMDFKSIAGIATLRGSVTSHTTILANSLKIPAVISLKTLDIGALEGKLGILDGTTGELIVEPDEDVLTEYRLKTEAEERFAQELKSYIECKAVTTSGQALSVYANIGSDVEAAAAYENGAEGIGLFRSEFLFLGRAEAPDEEEQLRAYKNALEYMNGRPVIIRTMDIGADKQVDYLNLKEEDNPQMGVRAIRISLRDTELFKIQLRALLRAARFGELRIMLPMIISVSEIERTKELIEECRRELKEKGIQFGTVKLGIMIETPAAALIADELGKHVDFFSIGTNDLVSYTLAVDRTNNELDAYRDDYHPAVQRLIRMTAEAAHKNNIEVGICGALGADPKLLDFYLEIGINELSVSVNKVLELKRIIINK